MRLAADVERDSEDKILSLTKLKPVFFSAPFPD
jgi:hypothetical protein